MGGGQNQSGGEGSGHEPKDGALTANRKVELAVWGGLGAVILLILVAFIATKFHAATLPVYAELPPFTLTNQDGQAFSLADLRGQVWIADAIFTRCPGQCLILSAHMKELQEVFPAGQPFHLVSLTTDPDFDQPAVLKKYAQRFQAQDGRWTFLTGTKRELHQVEVEGLKLAVVDKPAAERESATDLFLHSEKFVLLDQSGQIRGYFDGQESNIVAQVVAAAKTLAHF